mmetsp:Transcript_96093/g.215288  ORF Transcript_96093/g.215288 Transcript_96093/m.215288 type:complete len:231 (+) Transcript_96093:162-854(+)
MYHLILPYHWPFPSSPPSSTATGPNAILGSKGLELVFSKAALILSTSPLLGRRLCKRERFLTTRGSAFSSAVMRWLSTVDAMTCLAFLMATAARSCPWAKRSNDSVTVADSFGAPGTGFGRQSAGTFSTSWALSCCPSPSSSDEAPILNSCLHAVMRAARLAVPSKRMPASTQIFSVSGEYTVSRAARTIRRSMGSSAMAPGAMLRFTASCCRQSRALASSVSSAVTIFT